MVTFDGAREKMANFASDAQILAPPKTAENQIWGSVDVPQGTWSYYETIVMAYSEDKMKQVVLYFLEHINNVHLGRTKLMKLLYFVDFDHYEKHGEAITGAVYRKLPHGPVPTKVEKLIKKMVEKNEAREIRVQNANYTQHRLITLNAKFDPSVFTGAELQTLEKVAAEWADASAAEIETATHREAPWASTEDGKQIDYELAHYRRGTGSEPLDQELAGSKTFADYVAALA